MTLLIRELTGKRGGHEDRGEATNAADEWRIGEPPVLASNIMVIGICTTVDGNAHDDENLMIHAS